MKNVSKDWKAEENINILFNSLEKFSCLVPRLIRIKFKVQDKSRHSESVNSLNKFLEKQNNLWSHSGTRIYQQLFFLDEAKQLFKNNKNNGFLKLSILLLLFEEKLFFHDFTKIATPQKPGRGKSFLSLTQNIKLVALKLSNQQGAQIVLWFPPSDPLHQV